MRSLFELKSYELHTKTDSLGSLVNYAEYLLDHGVIDQIVHRHALRDTVSRLVSKLMNLP
jgi:acetyl-CoA carboxylase carboxyl transferase subunit beta